ncbi:MULTISPECIES: CU044_2847 family protein [unclassified Streptomyces]|uniref:CU044_2847 family protein n=1 Tax=unclassified Streptomyces TaxID=2593676 RepID=UPI0035DB8ECE
MMTEITKVELAGGVIYVEAQPLGPVGQEPTELEGRGGRLPDLSEVTGALSSFAAQLGEALHRAAPERVTVEFGCQLGIDSGALTALIVQGSASANFRVTLEWVNKRV